MEGSEFRKLTDEELLQMFPDAEALQAVRNAWSVLQSLCKAYGLSLLSVGFDEPDKVFVVKPPKDFTVQRASPEALVSDEDNIMISSKGYEVEKECPKNKVVELSEKMLFEIGDFYLMTNDMLKITSGLCPVLVERDWGVSEL